MAPEPLPNPEPLSASAGKKPTGKPPPLDIYIADVMARIPAKPLSSTFLGEFLMEHAFEHMPTNIWQTQVANVFWSAVFDLSKLEQEGRADHEAHTLPFVVRYGQEDTIRFDLVAFSKRQLGPAVRHFEEFVCERGDAFRNALERIAKIRSKANPSDTDYVSPLEGDMRRGLYAISKLPGTYLKEFAEDYAKKMHPCEVILPAPPLNPQASVPAPAVSVATREGDLGTCTADVVAQNQNDQFGVTMPGHALPLLDGQDYAGVPVWVAGEQGHIVTSHIASDSAFVHLPQGVTFPTRPFKSRLQTVAPGLKETLRFCGLATPRWGGAPDWCSSDSPVE